jgi:hypothetical protein
MPKILDWGDLRRLSPVGRLFGYYRGTPVDRYYIENFLDRHADDVRGRVLEVGDDSYTRRFAGARVESSDVLHIAPGAPKATLIADLACAAHIAANSFDCVIVTQTLHLIYDVRAAIATLHRIVRPGGVVLATVPGITQISHSDWGYTWYWAFTAECMKRLFTEEFAPGAVSVESAGNVLAATAMLYGLVVSELRTRELDVHDPEFEVCLAIRAVKA